MHIEFLVEEPSADVVLRNLVPRIIDPSHTFDVHPHQGKADLLRSLSARLRGYRTWLPADWRIVVLVDEDRRDCLELKGQLEELARQAGVVTRSAVGGGGVYQAVNRIAVEELEAWFFGDVPAIRAAYSRVPVTLENRKGFRDPDAIEGGTWEALERILGRAGYYRGRLPKMEAARRISEQMDPTRNRSKSFQVFRKLLQEIAP